MLGNYSAGRQSRVFIHRSIKTRIETKDVIVVQVHFRPVFIHRSIKTRIETGLDAPRGIRWRRVFIHRSIKTRIETNPYPHDRE